MCSSDLANSVAHSLARYANGLVEEVVWLEDSPPPTHDALYFDLSLLNERRLNGFSKKKILE